ncbi:hypothetical protein BHM03_00054080 [Ensete ventricosum]|nr:hypothetical protein BHM03_00054080 [Ensete ventricosum]
MKPCHDIASVISEEALESIWECYSIPEGYVLRAPLPEQRPYQPQPSEINILVDVLEAGLRFPLHPTIVECLRGILLGVYLYYRSEYITEEASDSRGKGAPVVDPERAQPEVEVTHAEASGKRSVRGSAPDPTATGRPKKQVKIAVQRHKAHCGEGSSRRVDREREPEVSAGDASPSYRQPKSMRDLCGIRIWEDDEGYYIL